MIDDFAFFDLLMVSQEICLAASQTSRAPLFSPIDRQED